MTPMPDGPESKLVWSSDPRELPPAVKTHFTVRSLATASHLAALGYEVTNLAIGRWLAPIAAQRDARRYEVTFVALKRGAQQREKADAGGRS
jgi:hypothetical protein